MLKYPNMCNYKKPFDHLYLKIGFLLIHLCLLLILKFSISMAILVGLDAILILIAIIHQKV
jgi:hypothetical protein